MGNRLSKIYTRTGDDGSTGLGDGSRIGKDALRVEAYGTVDEANSCIGLVLASEGVADDIRDLLTSVQHQLFDLGGELCIPGHAAIDDADIDRLAAASSTVVMCPTTERDLGDGIGPGGALAEAGVTPDSDDKLTPAPSTVLEDGLVITLVDVEVKQATKEAPIAFEKTSVKSADLAKGTSKVTTKGVAGLARETYTEVYENGVLVSSTLAERVVSRQPVAQVTTVGTKVTAPAESSSSSSSSGGAINLAREAMWVRIAECESGNRWDINTGNGYYGGLQFNLQTWRSVNGQDFAAYPHQASRAEQITVANRLYAIRGTSPWSCA